MPFVRVPSHHVDVRASDTLSYELSRAQVPAAFGG
jgi:hypothetical protein